MKTVLFVGAGRNQRRAIARVKELGARVVAVDRNAGAPGFAEADASEAVDFSDVPAVAEVGRRRSVDGVMTLASDAAVPIVAAVAEELGLPADGLRPIIYPVDLKPTTPPPPEPRGVLFAGRLEHRKGADVLIRAVPQVLARLPETRFTFLGADSEGPGGGSYSARMRELAGGLGVGDAIEFRARRGGPESVEEELRRATLCAVPSRWESMGYVAAEAAALGRPVVASRIEALEAIVDDRVSGRLVPVEDVDSWAAALVEVLSLPDDRQREMGEAGRRLIAERCDPRRIATQTLAAYEEAIERWTGSKAKTVG